MENFDVERDRSTVEPAGLDVRGGAAAWAAAALVMAAWAAPAAGQVTARVNVSSGGVQAATGSLAWTAISANGLHVAFASSATNLVAGDTNAEQDVFVRDRLAGTTELVSVATGGTQGNSTSRSWCSISADGRFVAFSSFATNLVAGDTNNRWDVFVRDRLAGTTERASVATGGAQGLGGVESTYPSISADGRYVAFHSDANNLVAGDTNFTYDVFLRDRQAGTTVRVSVDSGGAQGNDSSNTASISADGRYLAFSSTATNLVAGDTNFSQDIFVRDLQSGTTERVTVATGGAEGNGLSHYPSMSADGRYVAFISYATNLVAGDTNAAPDAFVRDRIAGTTERASVATGGAEGNSECYDPSISADGRFVAFESLASNLVAGDTNGLLDVFVRDRLAGTTERTSVATSGAQGNFGSGDPVISPDGRCVAFWSDASNLVTGDTNTSRDIFVRDRDATGFTSLCDPGVAGVTACPCANPPSGPGRGCDNSDFTGGATLSAAGVAYLATDSLVFTTSGEKPTATSILLQGDASAPAGLVFGQGVRCVGGSLKRLFVKNAVAGSITSPDFGAGDPTVSARSTALGDAIPPGASRWYSVYYRDPIVSGGCPASSTFNTTPSGAVAWWP